MKISYLTALFLSTASLAIAGEPANSGTLIMISSVSGWLIACGGVMLWRGVRKSRLAKKSVQ
jgi:hypothetical protein